MSRGTTRRGDKVIILEVKQESYAYVLWTYSELLFPVPTHTSLCLFSLKIVKIDHDRIDRKEKRERKRGREEERKRKKKERERERERECVCGS